MTRITLNRLSILYLSVLWSSSLESWSNFNYSKAFSIWYWWLL